MQTQARQNLTGLPVQFRADETTGTLKATGASKPDGVAAGCSAGRASLDGDLEEYQAAAAAATAAEATIPAPSLVLMKGVCALMLADRTELERQ